MIALKGEVDLRAGLQPGAVAQFLRDHNLSLGTYSMSHTK